MTNIDRFKNRKPPPPRSFNLNTKSSRHFGKYLVTYYSGVQLKVYITAD